MRLLASVLVVAVLALSSVGPGGVAVGKAAEGGVIVFGATGQTGARMVELLLERGESVTVFVRPTSDRSVLEGRDVSYAVGDAMNADDVEAAIAGAKPRAVINTIGNRGSTQGFWDRSQMAMTASGKRHGVSQLIFLSSVGVGDSAPAYSAAAHERFKDSIAERYRAEEDLKASGVDYTIIRTGIVLHAGSVETGQGRLSEEPAILAPIARGDLARLTVDCIGNEDCLNKTFTTVDDSIPVPEREE